MCLASCTEPVPRVHPCGSVSTLTEAHHMDRSCFVCPSIDENLDCFPLWLVGKCCCDHSCAVLVWTWVVISLRYVPRSGIAGSYGSSVINPLKDHRLFSKLMGHLRSHQRRLRGHWLGASLSFPCGRIALHPTLPHTDRGCRSEASEQVRGHLGQWNVCSPGMCPHSSSPWNGVFVAPATSWDGNSHAQAGI